MSDTAPRARIAVACSCGRRLTVRAELAGTRGRCPGCGALLEIPAAGLPARDEGAIPTAILPEAAVGSTCAVCQTAIEEGEPTAGCPACALPYHAECWGEYGGCAAYGCEKAPKQEKKPADARKECPYCGESIPAKALRCPACRERFEDARPVDREEFIQNIVDEPKRRATRTRALLFLAASLLPCLGPFMLVAGWVWLQNGKQEFEQVSGVYRVMVGAGAVVGGIHSLLLVGTLLGLMT